MMDCLIKALKALSEERKIYEEKNKMSGIDVGDELKDLLKVYTDADEHLRRKETDALNSLSSYMKRYLDSVEERKKVSEKLFNLKAKITLHEKCGCEDDEEGDDE